MIDREGIGPRWKTLGCKLDERGQRLIAANEVQAAGHGALKIVSEITGLARSNLKRGEDDLDEGPLPEGRVRRKGTALLRWRRASGWAGTSRQAR